MPSTLCIYHAGCVDGFTSAWIVSRHFGEEHVTLYGEVYGEPPPLELVEQHKRTILADFSYPAEDMTAIVGACPHVTVYDHHDTAEQALAPFLANGTVDGIFDQSRCGARITWDCLKPNQDAPPLLAYIEDWDLWRHQIPDGRAVSRAIRQYAHNLEIWDTIMSPDALPTLKIEGAVLEPYHRRQVQSVKNRAMLCELGMNGDRPYVVPVTVGLPELASEVAGELCAEGAFPFAALTYQTHEGLWVYQLRSAGPNAIHVGEFARDQFGGGGHPPAAGFTSEAPQHTFVRSMRAKKHPLEGSQ